MSNRSTAGRLGATTCAMMVAATIGAGSRDAGAVEQLQSYCSASWRNARIAQQDWTECTQAAFAELLGRIKRNRLTRAIEDSDSEERRELNRSIWCVVQRWRRAPRYATLEADRIEDRKTRGHESQFDDGDEIQDILASACLSSRQRHILYHWSHGQPIASIASDLSMSPAQVSDEKYRAIRSLRKEFA